VLPEDCLRWRNGSKRIRMTFHPAGYWLPHMAISGKQKSPLGI